MPDNARCTLCATRAGEQPPRPQHAVVKGDAVVKGQGVVQGLAATYLRAIYAIVYRCLDAVCSSLHTHTHTHTHTHKHTHTHTHTHTRGIIGATPRLS